MKLGDAAEMVAQPIARTVDYFLGTDIQGCGGCVQRRDTLNRFGDEMYDMFWPTKDDDKTKSKKKNP